MPLIFIRYPEGAFTPDALDTLAARISKDGGDLEGLAHDSFVRSTTWVYAHEYDPAKVYHGGKPGGARVITVELTTLQGGLAKPTKDMLIKRVTDAVAKAAGLASVTDAVANATGLSAVADAIENAVGAEKDVLPIYVLLHEAPPQNWGFSGAPLSFELLTKPPADAKPL